MEEHIETGSNGDLTGAGGGVEGVDNAESGLEGTRSDTGLEAHRGDVKNGSSGGLRAGTSGGGDGNEGLELLVDGGTLADGGVDEVHHVGLGVAREKVGSLGSVHGGTTTDGKEVGDAGVTGPVDGLSPRLVSRLNGNAVKDLVVEVVVLERAGNGLHNGKLGNVAVSEDGNLGVLLLSSGETLDHVDKVHADLAGGTGTETEGGRGHLTKMSVVCDT